MSSIGPSRLDTEDNSLRMLLLSKFTSRELQLELLLSVSAEADTAVTSATSEI
jgi:hypothetical protein